MISTGLTDTNLLLDGVRWRSQNGQYRIALGLQAGEIVLVSLDGFVDAFQKGRHVRHVVGHCVLPFVDCRDYRGFWRVDASSWNVKGSV